jgi:hypothetical protein
VATDVEVPGSIPGTPDLSSGGSGKWFQTKSNGACVFVCYNCLFHSVVCLRYYTTNPKVTTSIPDVTEFFN